MKSSQSIDQSASGLPSGSSYPFGQPQRFVSYCAEPWLTVYRQHQPLKPHHWFPLSQTLVVCTQPGGLALSTSDWTVSVFAPPTTGGWRCRGTSQDCRCLNVSGSRGRPYLTRHQLCLCLSMVRNPPYHQVSVCVPFLGTLSALEFLYKYLQRMIIMTIVCDDNRWSGCLLDNHPIHSHCPGRIPWGIHVG